MDLSQFRLPYTRRDLSLKDLEPHPMAQFERWFVEALELESREPNAMTLATADASGRPSARMVLLKGLDEAGFVFYSNYQSRKGRELDENPQAALVFYWPTLERQVRVEGPVTRVSQELSEIYFKRRPLSHQLSAWASQQSEPVESYERLEEAYRALEEKFGDEVPLPPNWGGYRLSPVTVEFWQGRPNRLHDRFLYSCLGGSWEIKRLSP